MSDYINREAIMQKFADHVRRSNASDFAPTPTWNEAVDIVEHFPAADVVERQTVLEMEEKRLKREMAGAELAYLQSTVDNTFRALINSAKKGW